MTQFRPDRAHFPPALAQRWRPLRAGLAFAGLAATGRSNVFWGPGAAYLRTAGGHARITGHGRHAVISRTAFAPPMQGADRNARNRHHPDSPRPPPPLETAQGAAPDGEQATAIRFPALLLVWIDHGSDDDWGAMCYPPMTALPKPASEGNGGPATHKNPSLRLMRTYRTANTAQ